MLLSDAAQDVMAVARCGYGVLVQAAALVPALLHAIICLALCISPHRLAGSQARAPTRHHIRLFQRTCCPPAAAWPGTGRCTRRMAILRSSMPTTGSMR
jgi:hypothetical protein